MRQPLFLFECEEDGCIYFEVQGNVAVGDRAFGDGRKRTFFAEKGDFFLCVNFNRLCFAFYFLFDITAIEDSF